MATPNKDTALNKGTIPNKGTTTLNEDTTPNEGIAPNQDTTFYQRQNTLCIYFIESIMHI